MSYGLRQSIFEESLEKSLKTARLLNMNINDRLLIEDGMLSPKIMPHMCNPGPEGYRIWAEAIDMKLTSLLGER